MRTAVFALCFATFAISAEAQISTPDITVPPPPLKVVELSGPRFGFTSLSDGVQELLHDRSIDVGTGISQFGWQFEREFYSRQGGLAVLNEWVVLAGGLEQGLVIPSLTWLVGLRSPTGVEFGLGPNVTPVGVALAVAGGVTIRSGALNVPITFAVVPSKDGMRVSMLTGFNIRRRH